MKSKIITFISGILLGLIVGFWNSFISSNNNEVANLDSIKIAQQFRVSTYVTTQLALDQDYIRSLEGVSDKHVLSLCQADFVQNFIRLSILRSYFRKSAGKNSPFYKVDTISDTVYNSAVAYLKQHPESWNTFPDMDTRMPPGDPVLPPVLNMHTFISAELGKK